MKVVPSSLTYHVIVLPSSSVKSGALLYFHVFSYRLTIYCVVSSFWQVQISLSRHHCCCSVLAFVFIAELACLCLDLCSHLFSGDTFGVGLSNQVICLCHINIMALSFFFFFFLNFSHRLCLEKKCHYILYVILKKTRFMQLLMKKIYNSVNIFLLIKEDHLHLFE